MNPYALGKIFEHVDRLRILKKGGQPAPVHLHLVLSDACNHNCNFCAYRQEGYTTSQLFDPGRFIPTEKVIEILEDAARMGMRAVQFTGGGEPTMHKDCALIIRIAQALGLETSLVTNGALMNKAVRTVLMQSHWVRISLDAGTKETYAHIRGLKNEQAFDDVLDNVRHLVGLRDAIAGSPLYIGIGFVVTHDNWREIPQAVELARSIGVDSIRFSAVFTIEGDRYFAEFGDEAARLCSEAQKHSTSRFPVIDNFTERRNDLKVGHPDFGRCHYQHFTTYIGADLNVYACCCIAYNNMGLIGSLKEQRFADFWYSRQKQEFMDNFDARRCPRCQFISRNREMAAVIENLPELHWNFV